MRQFHWHPSLAVEPGSGKLSGLDNDKTRRVPRCPTSHFYFLNFPAQLSPLTAQQSSLRPDPSKTTYPLLLLFLTLFYHICLRLLAIPSGNTKATQPNQPKDHPVAQQHQLDDSFATGLNLQDNVPRCSAGSLEFNLLCPKDTMTVTLCVTTATMPCFKNSNDLDEVHSLSRYCFLYSSLGGLRLLFISCCAKQCINHLASSLCLPPKDIAPGQQTLQALAPKDFFTWIKWPISTRIVDTHSQDLSHMDLSSRT